MIRIKQLREEFGYTQQELADKLNKAKSTIAMYENETRKPSLKVLEQLADIFNCSVDYILGISDKKETNILKDVRMASYNGVDVDGLSDKEIEEIKQFVEFVRNKNKR